MDPREEIRRAIAQGVRGEELTQLIAKHWDAINDLPDDEQSLFLQELYDDPEVTESVEDVVFDPEINELKTGIAPIFGGPQILARGGEGFKEITAAGSKFAAQQARQSAGGSPLLQKAVQLLMRNKGKATIAGLVGGISLFQGLEDERPPGEGPGGIVPPEGEGETPSLTKPPAFGQPGSPFTAPTTGPTATETEGQPVPDKGFNIMVVDHDGTITGTPGAVAVVSSAEMGLSPDPNLQNFIAEQTLATTGENLSANDFLSAYLQAGAQAQAVAGSDREVGQVLFPESMGQITVDVPFEVTPTTPTVQRPGGEIVSPERQRAERTGVPESVTPDQPGLVDTGLGMGELPGGPVRVTPDPQQIPGGAQLAPRIFREHRGRTLLEWAQLAAQRHGVPLNILYGIVDHESNWLPSAIGDNGTSFGLAQIHMPAWSNVSKAQAMNPVFALNWTADKLRQRFNTYGRWDAAVAAHNHPVAAQHLAKTGKFMTEKSANYVGDVMQRANRSGLADFLFEDPGTIPVTGSGPAGPQVPAFQAPDPAQSREFVRAQYEELLGRAPNEDEMKRGVEKIKGLARQAYSANVRNLKGAESQEVDIEAQFTEGIRESGEFEFHEEVGQTNDFTDFAAGIARLMQQGI